MDRPSLIPALRTQVTRDQGVGRRQQEQRSQQPHHAEGEPNTPPGDHEGPPFKVISTGRRMRSSLMMPKDRIARNRKKGKRSTSSADSVCAARRMAAKNTKRHKRRKAEPFP